MVFTYIKFGIALRQGVDLFKQGNYYDADCIFDKALTMKPLDFTVNYYKARTAIMVGDFENAKKYLKSCAEIKPQTITDLIEPLLNLLNTDSKIIPTAINKVNEEIEEKSKLYYNPQFKLIDIVKLSIILAVVSILAGALTIVVSKKYPLIPRYFTVAALWTSTLSIYYYYRPVIVSNLVIVLGNSFRLIKKSIKTPIILFFFASLILTSYNNLVHVINNPSAYINAGGLLIGNMLLQEISILTWSMRSVAAVLFWPISGEILCRGILYNYVSNYSRVLAYVTTAIVYFIFNHIDVIEVILFLFCTYVYDKYRSISITIVLNMLYGISSALVTITMYLSLHGFFTK